jgi:NAD(P)-dependent dehydrogenase (short-subunit alcohol dehydrogenase family)
MTARPAILITGGAKRVGAALARFFSTNGYDIALHYHHSETEAKQLQQEIAANGSKCMLFRHDLADAAGLENLVGKVGASFPACSALINNASVFERGELMQTSEELFDRQFAINLKAPFFLTQAFAKQFKSGHIVNVLDTDIVHNQVSHFAYLMSKKSLADFTKMAARALGPDISVNAVCPGCILPSDQNEEAYEQKMQSVVPLKSHPDTDDVAQSVYWLLQQKHITGQLIFVDGGKHVL